MTRWNYLLLASSHCILPCLREALFIYANLFRQTVFVKTRSRISIKELLIVYRSYFLQLLRMWKIFRKHLQRVRFWARALISQRDFRASYSAVRRQVYLGFPTLRLYYGVHWLSCPAILQDSHDRSFPTPTPQFSNLIPNFRKSPLQMVSGQRIPIICLKRLLIDTCRLLFLVSSFSVTFYGLMACRSRD